MQPAKDMTFPPGVVAGARYETFDGLVVTVSLVNKDGTDWARIAATGSGDAQARAADLDAKLSPWVFGLPTYKTKAAPHQARRPARGRERVLSGGARQSARFTWEGCRDVMGIAAADAHLTAEGERSCATTR